MLVLEHSVPQVFFTVSTLVSFHVLQNTLSFIATFQSVAIRYSHVYKFNVRLGYHNIIRLD